VNSITLVKTPEDIKKCFSVLVQLHEDLSIEYLLEFWNRNRESGFQFVYLVDSEDVAAVAGFHIGESLSWKRYLYVDDLVVDKVKRSKGYGSMLLDWIRNYAESENCLQIHLDSRVIRYKTHKFYLNQGFYIGGYHFVNGNGGET